MRESLIYQAILNEGIQQGKQEGWQEGREEGLHRGEFIMITQILREKYGELDDATIQHIQSLPSDQLVDLGKRSIAFHGKDDLHAWLRQQKPA